MMATQAKFIPFGLAASFVLLTGGWDDACLADAGRADEVIESFECSPRKGLIVLPVTLGDRSYNFVLDTGATRSVFDRRLRPLLGDPLGEVRVNETGRAEVFPWPEARLGKMVLASDKPVVCLDLAYFREVAGQEFFGFIGMDWLETMTFEIDPDRERISFLRPGRLPPPMLSRGIPLEIEGEKPRIRVGVAGLGVVGFVIDTGLIGNGRIKPEDLPKLIAARTVKSTQNGENHDLNGLYSTEYAAIESLSIGEHRHEWPVFSLARPGRNRLIGLEVLSRHVATFDMPQRRLYLEKANGFGDPWVFDQSGLILIRRRGETVAQTVNPHGPASGAGIKAGNVILSIGDKPASILSLWDISRLFSLTGSSHRLKVRGERGEFETTLILREW